MYNFKVFEFPNGKIHIRYYSIPISDREKKPKYVETYSLAQEQKKLNDGEWEIEPFKGKLVKHVLKENENFVRSNEEVYKMKNLARTRQRVLMYAKSCDWEWFLTFTLSPDCIDRYDYAECSKVMRQWLNNQKKRFAPDLKYIVVPEQHKDGAWHFHALLADVGTMVFADSGIVQKGRKVYNMSKWSYGFTTATQVADVGKTASYVSKYISKDLMDFLPHKQKYYVSQNIPEPQVSCFCLSQDEVETYVQTIADSVGREVVNRNKATTLGDYMEVTYFDIE